MEGESSGSLGALRESNTGRVIEALNELGTASRAQLARRTGLARSTVSSIVSELQAQEMIARRESNGSTPRGSGRPPSLISLNPTAQIAVGIDFGKRHLAVAAADLSHTVLAERRREMRDDYAAEEGFDAATELVESLLDRLGVRRDRVRGVGMGLPGPVHRRGTLGS